MTSASVSAVSFPDRWEFYAENRRHVVHFGAVHMFICANKSFKFIQRRICATRIFSQLSRERIIVKINAFEAFVPLIMCIHWQRGTYARKIYKNKVNVKYEPHDQSFWAAVQVAMMEFECAFA